MRSWVSVSLGIALMSGCGESTDPVDVTKTIEGLAQPGPHAVGYATFDVAYERPGAGGTRELTALIWYPSEPDPDGERPLYLLREGELATVDAPPKALGPRPVVVFSHGHQAYGAAMSYLMEHLASHGFIAVAPTHKGNTLTDGDNRETDIYYLRAFDVSATLDDLQSLPASDPVGALISDRFAIMGHSFGGYTAMSLAGAGFAVDEFSAACAAGTGKGPFCSTFDEDKAAIFASGLEDERFSAVVSIDPGDFDLFGSSGVAQVDLPVLHMAAEQSGFSPGAPAADPYWASLTGETDLRLLLLGGAHNDFVDACAAGVDLRCSDLPPPSVWRAVRVYTQAFLQKTLMGDTEVDPIVTGDAEVSGLIEVSTPSSR